MLNSTPHLSEKIFSKDVPLQSTRDGFGKALLVLGQKDKNIIVLTADLTESTRCEQFALKFPDRFLQVGVAEQNLATIAAGLATTGKTPFITSYAIFSPGRNWEQIRTTICINRLPVKIVGSHAGIVTGPDGATHQVLEDIALTRVLPHLTVLSPCDSLQAAKATLAAAVHPGPVYLRLARPATPVITTPKTPFTIGKAQIFWQSAKPQVTLVATGPLLYQTLLAAKQLEKQNIGSIVINCPTIKPLDQPTLLFAAKTTRAIVTIEDHQIFCGFGSSIAELFAAHLPVPIEFVGVNDTFGQSGSPEDLINFYHLSQTDIVQATKRVIQRKAN